MRIIEEEKEKKVRCPHCYSLIGFRLTKDEIHSTYTRGLELNGVGWIDGDRLWHYIMCPNCNNYISIDSVLEMNDFSMLQSKYDKEIEESTLSIK